MQKEKAEKQNLEAQRENEEKTAKVKQRRQRRQLQKKVRIDDQQDVVEAIEVSSTATAEAKPSPLMEMGTAMAKAAQDEVKTQAVDMPTAPEMEEAEDQRMHLNVVTVALLVICMQVVNAAVACVILELKT